MSLVFYSNEFYLLYSKVSQFRYLIVDKMLVSGQKLKDFCDYWIFKGYCFYYFVILVLFCQYIFFFLRYVNYGLVVIEEFLIF